MELFVVDTLEESIDKLYKKVINTKCLNDIEEVESIYSLNRILANDVVSNEDSPMFDRSTVDGYAVISNDTQGATDTIPCFLDVIYEVKMGENINCDIKPGECMYVPTGGMIPKSADAVIMIEWTENLTDKKIAVYNSIPSGKNVLKKSSDVSKNQIVLNKSKIITSSDIALFSMLGIKNINVYKKINVTIISTGDELVEWDSDNLEYGKIRDTNTNYIFSECINYNFNVIGKYLIKDDYELLNKIVLDAKKNSDLILLSGGSSKGKKDYTNDIIKKNCNGNILTHGISIKPGKPTITSFDEETNTIIIGLPGNPQAAVLIFRLLIIGLYEKITNANFNKNKICMGYLMENVPATPGRMTIQLVDVDDDFNIYPIYSKSNSVFKMCKSVGFIIIKQNVEGLNKGDIVKVYYL